MQYTHLSSHQKTRKQRAISHVVKLFQLFIINTNFIVENDNIQSKRNVILINKL